MDILNGVLTADAQWLYALYALLALLTLRAMVKLVRWAKGMPRGAYIFLAFFPLISLFPIPPPVFKNVEKAKQTQRKRKEVPGDPPDDEEQGEP